MLTSSFVATSTVARPLRCLVVDSDPTSQLTLHQYFALLPSLQVIGFCANAPEALMLLHAQSVDVLFLDVRLPLLSGLELLHLLLHRLAKPPFTVFVTDSAAYGVQAFDYAVTDYLLKPVSFSRFLQTIQKIELLAAGTLAATSKPKPAEFIFVKTGKQLTRVNFTDVYYLQAHGSYVHIMTSHQRLTVLTSLRALQRRLPTSGFLLIHRSYLVNIRFIKSVEEHTLTIKEVELPISPGFRAKLVAALNVL